MKKHSQNILIGIVLLLSLSVNLFASSAKKISTFSDTKNGFKVEIGSEWKVRHMPDSNDLIKLEAIWKNDSGFQIRKYSHVKKSLKSFSGWFVDHFEKEMGGSRGKIQLESYTNQIIANNSCWIIIHSYNIRSQHWILVNYLFQNGKNMIVFQGGVLKSLEKEYQKKLMIVLKSLLLI